MEPNLENNSNPNEEMRKRLEERMAAREKEFQLKSLLKQVLEASAYERLTMIKLSNPELYEKIASLLLNWAQAGQLTSKISEEKLKLIASKLTSHRQTSITINRK